MRAFGIGFGKGGNLDIGQWGSLKIKSNRQGVARLELVRIAFGHQLQRQAGQSVLALTATTDIDQQFRIPFVKFFDPNSRLVAVGVLRQDSANALLLNIGVELFPFFEDKIERVAVIGDGG